MTFSSQNYRLELDAALARMRKREKALPAGSMKAARGRPPKYGVDRVTMPDDDWWRRKVGAGGTGTARTNYGLPSFARPLMDNPGRDASASLLLFGHDSRMQAKLGLASGGQSAVVKLASFGGGSARLGALMRYQSQGGTLSLERADGSLVSGNHAISALARDWANDSHRRKATDDVVRFVITTARGEAIDSDAINVEARLTRAFPGHRLAFRSEEIKGGGLRIEVVMSAAARSPAGSKKAERFFNNQKSRSRLESAAIHSFGDPSTAVEIKGFAHGVAGVARFLAQMTRTGSHEAYSLRYEGRSARVAGLTHLGGHEDNLAEARRWERDLRSQVQRDAMHLILSSKPGTDGEAFLDAARSMLARSFAGHDYVFAMHRDRGHLHVHAAVRMDARQGSRLHPNINDFRQWRQIMAEEARQRGIEMYATHDRFEQANPPSYRLKDIQRYARGVATPAIQRRVEAVRNNAVYVPVRSEGRAALLKSESGWRELSARLPSGTPLQAAASFYHHRTAHAVALIQEREITTAFARTIATWEQDVIAPLTREHASTNAGRNLAFQQKEHDMAELARMRAAYAQIDNQLDEMEKLMPKDDIEAFRRARRQVEVATREALGAQEQTERLRGGFEGQNKRHVRPVAMFELGNFDVEQQENGETIRYRHRTETGQSGHIAFVDQGAKVQVHDWTNREAVLGAMQLASDKWGAINVTGSKRYKAMVVELAAEHGISVANPELQDKLEAARQRFAREAEKQPGFTEAEPGQAARIIAGRKEENQTEAGASEDGQSIGQEIKQAPEDSAPDEKLHVSDPYNEEAVLKDLQAANRKWGALQLESKDEHFLVVAVKVAAENNIPIRNSELQELYRAEQDRIAYEAHARPGLVNPAVREEEGREAWNKVTIAAIQLAGAKDTERFDEAHKTWQSELRAAARLAMYGNHYLTELAKQESTLSSELMIVEAEEELRLASLEQRPQPEQVEERAEDEQAETTGPAKPAEATASEGQRSATGILLQTGQALYRQDDPESMTPYAELRNDAGKIERLWGVTMPKALIDAQARNGDRVSIVLDGTETVEKRIPVINKKTGEKTYEMRDVERNVWTVTVHRQEKQKEQNKTATATDKPAAKSAVFKVDHDVAEKHTGKSWSELNTLEKTREHERQLKLEAARHAPQERAGNSGAFKVDRDAAEKHTGRSWSEMNTLEQAREHERQLKLEDNDCEESEQHEE